MAEKTQLNGEVDVEVVARVRRDVFENNVVLGDYIQRALETFLRFPKEERKIRLNGLRKKVLGRKLEEA